MFGGLAVGLGLKAGLFNIGVAGQFLVGAFAAAVTGASLATAPTIVAMPLAMLAGALGGAAYGFIPGYLKARTGAHEVVTTIMLNNVAVLLLTWAVNDLVRAPGFSFPRTGEIGQSALPDPPRPQPPPRDRLRGRRDLPDPLDPRSHDARLRDPHRRRESRTPRGTRACGRCSSPR